MTQQKTHKPKLKPISLTEDDAAILSEMNRGLLCGMSEGEVLKYGSPRHLNLLNKLTDNCLDAMDRQAAVYEFYEEMT